MGGPGTLRACARAATAAAPVAGTAADTTVPPPLPRRPWTAYGPEISSGLGPTPASPRRPGSTAVGLADGEATGCLPPPAHPASTRARTTSDVPGASRRWAAFTRAECHLWARLILLRDRPT